MRNTVIKWRNRFHVYRQMTSNNHFRWRWYNYCRKIITRITCHQNVHLQTTCGQIINVIWENDIKKVLPCKPTNLGLYYIISCKTDNQMLWQETIILTYHIMMICNDAIHYFIFFLIDIGMKQSIRWFKLVSNIILLLSNYNSFTSWANGISRPQSIILLYCFTHKHICLIKWCDPPYWPDSFIPWR